MRVDIQGAMKHTGFTEYAIRKAVREKMLPVYRIGRGKMVFDTDLLDETIRDEMLKSMGKQ